MRDARLAYIHSDTPNNIRVTKCLRTFAKLFRHVFYIGCWRHRRWEGAGCVAGVDYRVLDKQMRCGPRSLLDMPAFVRHLRTELANTRPDVVVTTNEDLVPLFGIRLLPRPRVLICDLIDSVAMRITGPARHLQALWSGMAAWTRHYVDAIVEVTNERLQRYRILPRYRTVIMNTPGWTEVAPEPAIPPNSIYVCGSIVDHMSGVEALLQACENTPGLSIVFAGRPIGNWVRQKFINHPRVRFYGEISPERSMALAASCAAIFAHYNPIIKNHIFAAPNKVYDAMMIGVPVLINTECRISSFARQEGFGLTTPYGDVFLLQEMLGYLATHSADLGRACRAAKQKFRTEYAWERMEHRWADLFAQLGFADTAATAFSQTLPHHL